MMARQVVPENELFIVDDDEAMREALTVVFTLAGYRVTVFADGESFIGAARRHAPAAVLLDLNLPDRTGLEALKDIDAQHFPAPIFMISGDGDIAHAVEAVKAGAFDYMVKPFEAQVIVARVGNAIAAFARGGGERGTVLYEFAGQALLTPREREVLAQIAAGASNKEAGRELGISPRTIEVHRARIMEKLGARNAADLVRIVLSNSGNGRATEIASGMVA
ncbi:MAG TPA: response regulator [Pseudolabrys sp.]|nr:response regulator [Pseudolabrys sp.]